MAPFFEALAPGSALLNSRSRTAFNVDWADPSASILICAECGRIEWFAHEPGATSDQGAG